MRSPNKKNQTTQLRTLNAANEALSVEKVLEWCQLAITTDVNDIDFRPIWKILTDNNGEVELIQILREMPKNCWLEECINEAQRKEWKSLKNICLEAHEYLVYSHLNCKVKKFILKDFYADLTDWYLSFYDIIRYGFDYIQRFADKVERGIEIEMLESKTRLLESKTQRKRFSDSNKMLWQIRECRSKLQTPEEAFRSVVTEDFYFIFSATQKPVFRSQPTKSRKMRKLDYQLRSNPHKVSKRKTESFFT